MPGETQAPQLQEGLRREKWGVAVYRDQSFGSARWKHTGDGWWWWLYNHMNVLDITGNCILQNGLSLWSLCHMCFFHNKKKTIEQKEIPASAFLLDHSLWEKPSAILWGYGKHLRQDSRGEGQRPLANSPNTSSSGACGSNLGSGSSGQARLSENYGPENVLIAASSERLPWATQLSSPQAPLTHRNCEIIRVYCCPKQPSVGVICYTAVGN